MTALNEAMTSPPREIRTPVEALAASRLYEDIWRDMGWAKRKRVLKKAAADLANLNALGWTITRKRLKKHSAS